MKRIEIHLLNIGFGFIKICGLILVPELNKQSRS